jgi:serine/threonine-protein kinase
VLELIGQGGHACVFRVHDEFLDKCFALKVLFSAGGVTPEMLRRGQTEAQFLSSVRHPHIVEVVRAGIERGLLFIVMELLVGRPLQVVLQLAGRLEVEEVLALGAQVTDALAFAHERKALHRDLKPDNLFVCPYNTAKVLDFGIAKLADGGGWQTQRDLVVGTMLYMSPEQLLGQPLTPASDVYALGLIMYTALLGRHPCLLESDAPSHEELARMQILRVPPRLDQLAAHVPDDVGQLVAHALAKEPGARIASMVAFGRAIREALERRLDRARGAGIPLQVRDLSSCDFNGAATQTAGAEAAGALATRTDIHVLPSVGFEQRPGAVATPAPLAGDPTPSARSAPAAAKPARYRGAAMASAAFAAVAIAGAWLLASRSAPGVNEAEHGANQALPSTPSASPAAEPQHAPPSPVSPSRAAVLVEIPSPAPVTASASADLAPLVPRPTTVPERVASQPKPSPNPQASSSPPKPFSERLPSSGL